MTTPTARPIDDRPAACVRVDTHPPHRWWRDLIRYTCPGRAALTDSAERDAAAYEHLAQLADEYKDRARKWRLRAEQAEAEVRRLEALVQRYADALYRPKTDLPTLYKGTRYATMSGTVDCSCDHAEQRETALEHRDDCPVRVEALRAAGREIAETEADIDRAVAEARRGYVSVEDANRVLAEERDTAERYAAELAAARLALTRARLLAAGGTQTVSAEAFAAEVLAVLEADQ